MGRFDLTDRVVLISGATDGLGRALGRFFDGLREAEPDAQASDPAARRRLWELSERLTAQRA